VALVQGAAALLDKAGATRTAQWLQRMPRGLATALHQELQWLIYTELLELPYAQAGRASHRDVLMEHILADPRIAALCDAYTMQLHSVAERPAFRAALARHLEEYGKTRGACSELAGSLLNLDPQKGMCDTTRQALLPLPTRLCTSAHLWHISASFRNRKFSRSYGRKKGVSKGIFVQKCQCGREKRQYGLHASSLSGYIAASLP